MSAAATTMIGPSPEHMMLADAEQPRRHQATRARTLGGENHPQAGGQRADEADLEGPVEVFRARAEHQEHCGDRGGEEGVSAGAQHDPPHQVRRDDVESEQHGEVWDVAAQPDHREEPSEHEEWQRRPVLVVRDEEAELADTGDQPVDELPVILGEPLPPRVPEQPRERHRQRQVVERRDEPVGERRAPAPRRTLELRRPVRQERVAACVASAGVSSSTGRAWRPGTSTVGATWPGRQKRWRSSTPRAFTPSDGRIFLPSSRDRAT